MESIAAELAKNEIQSSLNWVRKQAKYLCCFNSYAREFEQATDRLNAKLQDVRGIIDTARGASHVTCAALQWKREAEKLIDVDVEKVKCFNDLCINCWRQYCKGRDLAKRTLEIDRLLERCNFDIVNGPTDLPGIKYRCLPNFMHFESRKSTFQELKAALEDEENNVIGLQGLGGTGKTSMAIEVGAKLEGSTFGKVIFLVVSKPPDFKRLRGDIARHLALTLKDTEENVHHEQILTRIKALEEKLLIVLDDVWMEFDLTNELGVPPRHMHKGCIVLITTRNKEICTRMDCQRNINLDALTDKEALPLFFEHANCSSNLESLAQNIVGRCHGIPVVIVAVARSLKGRPSTVWKEALRNLQNGNPILNVNDDLKGVYEGLKLSYDNLKNEKSKQLLLISSLFPEDFDIPIQFLTGIGVGMGPFVEGDDYNERRRVVLNAIVELLDSSLLLNAETECVKMHDLVREVALLIGETDVQSIIGSELPVKKGLQCLFWKNDDFPRHCDGRNLEVLFLVRGYPKDLEVPNAFFTDMTKLKVLFLESEAWYGISGPSLFPSIQSLQDIRTLKITRVESCSISMLGRLPNLETLWLDCCSIIKFPGENFDLGKLRFLRIEDSEINMSNPFELIEACPKLEELTFFGNEYGKQEEEDKIYQKASFHTLQIYQISSEIDFLDYFEQYGSLSRCFDPGNLMHLISEATFKQLATRAELLILRGNGETKQENLIPDIIVPVDDKCMTDLIILRLYSWPGMQCLIDAVNNHFDVKNAFFNLAELDLSEMGLSNILFDGHYNLCHLRTLKLANCPKLTSIFLPSTAQSLSKLEVLMIDECDALECIVEDKSSRGDIAGVDGGNDQKSYSTLFPKFKILEISSCDNLKIILPILPSGLHLERIAIVSCEKLKCLFGKFQEVNAILPHLERMELVGLPSLVGVFGEHEKSICLSLQQPASTPPSTKTHSFSWPQVCCFKSKATSDEADGAVSTRRLLDEEIPQEFDAFTDGVPPFHASQSLLVQTLKNVTQIQLWKCGNLISLSTLSIAASITSLQYLTVRECHKLKCITKHDREAHFDENYCSIFPKLEELEIVDCEELEFLFVSAISGGVENLKSLTIEKVPELKYGFGQYHQKQLSSNQNHNDVLHFDLLVLETLYIKDAPKINGICTQNYKLVLSSLLDVKIQNSGIKSFTDYNMEEFDAFTDGVPPFHAAQSLLVQTLKNVRNIKLEKCGNVISLSKLSIAASIISLQYLTVRECHKLKCITTHERDARVDKNYYSIFPTLEKLEIVDCKDLEFLFLLSLSVGLEKLKSLTVNKVPELKYVVGKYQQEQYSSNQNQNDDLHFRLPALETLSVDDAPKINSFSANNYKLVLSPHLAVEMRNCGIKSFAGYDMVNLTAIKEVHASTDEAPLFHAAQSLMTSKSIRKMELVKCTNLISVSTLCIASMILLEDLTIRDCDQLKCIVADERDAGNHINCNAIFPKLKLLQVSDCNALEYLFPTYAFRCPSYLESLIIFRAPMLKYVFGRSQHEDTLENQNIQAHIDLPALKYLSIMDAPKFISICPENYYLRGSSLRSVLLQELPELTMRSFNEFFVCWHTKQQETKAIEMHLQSLKSLVVRDSKIDVIFDLTNMNIEQNGDGIEPLTSSLQELELRNLSEMVNLCVGPKRIVCFHSLQKLIITSCKKLKVIFSTSMVRSLPMLMVLYIANCEELAHIVEEDYGMNADDHLHHEPCFSNLERVHVFDCDKLKYLFSITICDILPKLSCLEIRRGYELEHVLGKGVVKEMVIKDVLPELRHLTLVELPNVVSVCDGSNFEILNEDCRANVLDCPKFSFYDETSSTQLQAGPEIAESQVEEKAENISSHLSIDQSLNMGDEPQQSLTKEATAEIVEVDFISQMEKMTTTSSDPKLPGQLVVEARATKGVSSNTLCQISLASDKKVPIHASPNLTVLPTRDNTHASDKIFEEQEQEQGSLIASRCPQSGMKADSSLSKEKLETFIHDNPFVHPIKTNLTEQTLETTLSLSPALPKGSINLNQTPSFVLPNPSDGPSFLAKTDVATASVINLVEDYRVDPSDSTQDDVEVCDKSHPHSTTSFEGVDDGDIQEVGIVQNESKSNIEPSNPTQREQELSYSKDSHPRRAMPTRPLITISENESSKEPILVSPNATILARSPSTTTKIFEEEETGGLLTTHRHQSDMKVTSSLLVGKQHKTSNCGDPFVPPMPIISSEHQASETILALGLIPSKALTSPKQIPMAASFESSYGVPEVKEIADMMKLEDVELSMLAEAFKTNPQLRLSSKDRSTELLRYSYKVLLNILNILSTRSPFTITEADKRLLAKHLNDASVLGFDKDWLDSTRNKVFNCDASELHRMQQALKGLGNKFQANEIELANVRDQEAKAAKLVQTTRKELEATHKKLEAANKGLEAANKWLEAAQSHFNDAQQEHTNITVHHCQLLEECQEISEQQYQWSEIIAAKFRPFGF